MSRQLMYLSQVTGLAAMAGASIALARESNPFDVMIAPNLASGADPGPQQPCLTKIASFDIGAAVPNPGVGDGIVVKDIFGGDAHNDGSGGLDLTNVMAGAFHNSGNNTGRHGRFCGAASPLAGIDQIAA